MSFNAKSADPYKICMMSKTDTYGQTLSTSVLFSTWQLVHCTVVSNQHRIMKSGSWILLVNGSNSSLLSDSNALAVKPMSEKNKWCHTVPVDFAFSNNTLVNKILFVSKSELCSLCLALSIQPIGEVRSLTTENAESLDPPVKRKICWLIYSIIYLMYSI